ncbi:MAG: TerB family tellurite resistance protein [Chitinophagales bacterium]|nr:TerB family tellurite resistance protein [Chitinophagales bacterium]
MKLQGKVIGGVIGMILGRILLKLPIGVLVGFIAGSVLGHYFFDQFREAEAEDSENKEYRRRQGQYLYFVFALCAKMAKADGAVNRQEINHMEVLMRTQFRLNDRDRNYAIKIWKEAKESEHAFEVYAAKFYQEFGRERYQVMNMIDYLFSMAACDGGLHPLEEQTLLKAAGIFHISRMQYERVKARYYHVPPSRQQSWNALDPYYAILGAESHESMDAIKKKFRALALKWHPDTVGGGNASPEVLRHAKEKFQKINEAYEKISEARKIRS